MSAGISVMFKGQIEEEAVENQKNLAAVLRGQDHRSTHIIPVLEIISLECFEERSSNMRPP